MPHPYPIFAKRARTYLNAQDPEIERLKALVEGGPDLPHILQFREEFREILDTDTLSRAEFEAASYQEFDTDEEFRAWLRSLWNHLFEDGPQPPV